MSFWQANKPLYALAPMADVTDSAYRKLIAEYSKSSATAVPYVTWTEFVSADGLYATRERKGMADDENPLVRDLRYTEGERPIVAQLFTSNPDTMEYAAAYALAQGFDGVDINMGCPDKSIEKQGAGAAHIKDPARAKEVIAAAIRGTQGKIPVSVKTRIGYNKLEYKEWLPHVLDTGIAGLTLHLRTRKEMSLVPAHYELASEIAAFVKGIRSDIPLLANGDLRDVADANARAVAAGFDGAMLGRAVFGNPWLFANETTLERTPAERIEALQKLAAYFTELVPGKHFAILKKHFKAFISGWPDAAELRNRLMATNTLEEMREVLASV